MAGICNHRGCNRERHPNPDSDGRCGDCWRADEEHEAYQRRRYEYWNSRGRGLAVKIEPRTYNV